MEKVKGKSYPTSGKGHNRQWSSGRSKRDHVVRQKKAVLKVLKTPIVRQIYHACCQDQSRLYHGKRLGGAILFAEELAEGGQQAFRQFFRRRGCCGETRYDLLAEILLSQRNIGHGDCVIM